MLLGQALGLRKGEVVAFVGAGGKTTALFQLAHDLLAQGQRIVATTTTHMLPPPANEWPLVLTEDPGARQAAAAQALAEKGRVFVAARREDEGRLAGVALDDVAALSSLADTVLVEADGARGRWLKAPAVHEPAIPPSATTVVPVAGLRALGQPVGSPVIHRPERLAALLGLAPNAPILEGAFVRLLLDPEGGRRGIPAGARLVPLCNQAEGLELRAAGRRIAAGLLRVGGTVSRVVVGAVQSEPGACECWQPSAVIVLAAGAGVRFGGLKQAARWQGRPFLARIAAAALESLATEVVVVLGCGAAEIEPLIASQASARLRIVRNPGWEEGLAGSVRAGLRALTAGVESAVFCTADQPRLSAHEIDALLARQAGTGAPIVAPRYCGEARSPALFARPFFAELAGLSGDVGGRAILRRHAAEAEYVEVVDPRPYEDVDTPADYERLLGEDDGTR